MAPLEVEGEDEGDRGRLALIRGKKEPIGKRRVSRELRGNYGHLEYAARASE